MALQGWDKNYREQLKIQEQEIESLQQQLMIAGKGGSPGQPYDDPEKGKGPFVPAPPRDKLASLQIRPNQIMLPFAPKDAETDDMYGEGVDEIEGLGATDLAHGEGRGPQPKYHDEYNRPLDMPPWIQMFPDGKLREIPWMKEKYLNEHPELASGPDYIGDKLRYGQLDRILNPLGDFRKPTLDQLRIHSKAYPKA